MNSVYALTDPRTDEIRYIGITQDLDSRIKVHRRGDKSSKAMVSWREELKDAGVVMSFKVLQSGISPKDATEAEKNWITKAKNDGCRLLNVREGKKAVPRTAKSYYIQIKDVPIDLHRAIKAKAALMGMTIEAYVIRTIENGVKEGA